MACIELHDTGQNSVTPKVKFWLHSIQVWPFSSFTSSSYVTNIHNICLCLWHLFLTSLSPSLIVIAICVFISGLFSSFTISIVSSTLRQWTLLCMITWFPCFFSSYFSFFSVSHYLFSSWHLALSSAFLFCSSFFFYFCSLSCFHFSFSSSSCFFFKAFFSRILIESALVRTLAPETVWEDFLDFGVSGAGLTW